MRRPRPCDCGMRTKKLKFHCPECESGIGRLYHYGKIHYHMDCLIEALCERIDEAEEERKEQKNAQSHG